MTVEYIVMVAQTMGKKNKHNQYANLEFRTGNKIGTNMRKGGEYSNLLNHCTVITLVLYKNLKILDDCHSFVPKMQHEYVVNLREQFDYIKFPLKKTHLQFGD